MLALPRARRRRWCQAPPQPRPQARCCRHPPLPKRNGIIRAARPWGARGERERGNCSCAHLCELPRAPSEGWLVACKLVPGTLSPRGSSPADSPELPRGGALVGAGPAAGVGAGQAPPSPAFSPSNRWCMVWRGRCDVCWCGHACTWVWAGAGAGASSSTTHKPPKQRCLFPCSVSPSRLLPTMRRFLFCFVHSSSLAAAVVAGSTGSRPAVAGRARPAPPAADGGRRRGRHAAPEAAGGVRVEIAAGRPGHGRRGGGVAGGAYTRERGGDGKG